MLRPESAGDDVGESRRAQQPSAALPRLLPQLPQSGVIIRLQCCTDKNFLHIFVMKIYVS